jgi:hypothetical protein
MSSQKHHELMKNLDRCYDAVLLSSPKGGISAAEISKKIGMHKTIVHRNLNTLEIMGKVEDRHGVWRVTGEQTIKPSEKEIAIELPMPKNQWRQVALLEMLARDCEEHQMTDTAEMYRIPLEKLKETRTITIRGKNVDDLDLQRLGNLIQEANEKASKFNLKRLIKNLKRSHPTQNE